MFLVDLKDFSQTCSDSCRIDFVISRVLESHPLTGLVYDNYNCNVVQPERNLFRIFDEGIYEANGIFSQPDCGCRKQLYFACYDGMVKHLSADEMEDIFRGNKTAAQVIERISGREAERGVSDKKHVTVEIVTSEYISVEQDIFEQAEAVFKQHGLTFARAVEEFFRHCVKTHSVPFTQEDMDAYKAELAREVGEDSQTQSAP